MIFSLEGEVVAVRDTFAVIQVNGIGYKVFLSRPTLETLQEDTSRIKVYCELRVKEDVMALYGFQTEEELNLFLVMESVSGVGPKAALELACIGSVDEFRRAIAARDEKFFSGIHGVGKKKVQKIILELTGKIEDISNPKEQGQEEVLEALGRLGFSKKEARAAMEHIGDLSASTEEKVREVLRAMGKKA